MTLRKSARHIRKSQGQEVGATLSVVACSYEAKLYDVDGLCSVHVRCSGEGAKKREREKEWTRKEARMPYYGELIVVQ